jgi:hypothetical protein
MLQKKQSMKLKLVSKFKQSLLFSLASRERQNEKGCCSIEQWKEGCRGAAIKIKNKNIKNSFLRWNRNLWVK